MNNIDLEKEIELRAYYEIGGLIFLYHILLQFQVFLAWIFIGRILRIWKPYMNFSVNMSTIKLKKQNATG